MEILPLRFCEGDIDTILLLRELVQLTEYQFEKIGEQRDDS
jgi:hypothetical protein